MMSERTPPNDIVDDLDRLQPEDCIVNGRLTALQATAILQAARRMFQRARADIIELRRERDEARRRALLEAAGIADDIRTFFDTLVDFTSKIGGDSVVERSTAICALEIYNRISALAEQEGGEDD
jgi:hypothetical protein